MPVSYGRLVDNPKPLDKPVEGPAGTDRAVKLAVQREISGAVIDIGLALRRDANADSGELKRDSITATPAE